MAHIYIYVRLLDFFQFSKSGKCALAGSAGRYVGGMNADIPFFQCWVRQRHISKREGLEEAYAFAIQSVKGRALGFHMMLRSGAHYRNVPLHALCLSKEAPEVTAEQCAYWDCFSSRPVVTVFDYLKEHECTALLPGGSKERGIYLFTVDWLPDSSERPGFVLLPNQNKCGHVLALETGNICMLPSNKVVWRDGYWVGNDPSPEKQGYVAQQSVYHAENADRDFSKSDLYFY